MQPDGKILAPAGGGRFNLMRINPDGSLDQSFGDDGILAVLNPSIAEFEWVIRDFALQPDGKILVAGNMRLLTGFDCPPLGGACHDIYTNDFLLARFNTDGSLDIDFGTNGKITSNFSYLYSTETNDYIEFIVVQDNGSIIGVGTNNLRNSDPYEEHTIIVRYTPEGLLDTSFGSGGTIEFSLTLGYTLHIASHLLSQPDGKFIIRGYKGDPVYTNYLVRYDANCNNDA